MGTGNEAIDKRRVAVVIPIPNDPDWSIFEELSDEIPIIVCDDSDGKLSVPPRRNVTYYDYAAQRDIMGEHYDAIPHKSAASRNFGHFLAHREGYEVVVALDYDCRVPSRWLEQHLDTLTDVKDAPARKPVIENGWVNSIAADGFYARGYPYELRHSDYNREIDATATGSVKVNMGLWEGIVDLNGIDRVGHDAPYHPGTHDEENRISLGNIPACGMNTAFTADLTPAYYFLPDLWVDDGSPGGWQLSRHDDIWGGYILKKLMDKRGDLFSYGRPIVEHTRLTPAERTTKIEHYMHLMARQFFAAVDAAMERTGTGDYATMYASFVDAFLGEVTRSGAPTHYKQIYRALGEAMRLWAQAFA